MGVAGATKGSIGHSTGVYARLDASPWQGIYMNTLTYTKVRLHNCGPGGPVCPQNSLHRHTIHLNSYLPDSVGVFEQENL